MGKIQDMANMYEQLGITRSELDEILKYYRKGRGEQHIRTIFGISENTLNRIIKDYSNNQIEKERKEAIEKWANFDMGKKIRKPKNTDIKVGEKQELSNKHESIGRLVEAIKNVNPVSKGEER